MCLHLVLHTSLLESYASHSIPDQVVSSTTHNQIVDISKFQVKVVLGFEIMCNELNYRAHFYLLIWPYLDDNEALGT